MLGLLGMKAKASPSTRKASLMGTVSCIVTTRTFDRPLLVSGSERSCTAIHFTETGTECMSEAEELVGDYATSMPPDRKLLQCTYAHFLMIRLRSSCQCRAGRGLS